MRVRLSEQARTDLFEIGEWIEKDSPARAQSFVEELFDACMSLADFPNAFSRVPGPKGTDIRRRVHGSYSIFYVVGKQVEILHVLHSARDFRPIVFPSAR